MRRAQGDYYIIVISIVFRPLIAHIPDQSATVIVWIDAYLVPSSVLPFRDVKCRQNRDDCGPD